LFADCQFPVAFSDFPAKTQRNTSIFKNSTGTINRQDEIIFLGKRAAGDTTWLDNYTSEAVFYLYYDDSFAGKRLTEYRNDEPVGNYISTVDINEHIEYEKEYDGGREYAMNETFPYEGWFWKKLEPHSDSEFFYSAIIPALNSANDSLSILLHYATADSLKSSYSSKVPYYRIKYLINYDEIEDISFKEKVYGDFSIRFSNKDIFPGINIVGLNALQVDGQEIDGSSVFVDYVELSGKVQPFASNGNSEFFIENLNEKSRLKVPGFSNSEILAIDPVSGTIIYPRSESGTSILAGTRAVNLPYTSIVLNDYQYSSDKKGWHIGFLSSDNFIDYDFRYFNISEAEVRELLDSIPANSIITVAYNGDDEINSGVLESYFSGMGANEVSSHQAGQSWIFTYQKSASYIDENINGNIASITGFIPHDDGKSFQAKTTLNKDNSYSLVFTDANIIETAKVSEVTKSDLKENNQKADAVIVTHKEFNNASERLAQHRSDHQNLEVMLVDIDNIYKEFSYGKKSPHAIKEFLKYSLDNWEKAPGYLLLVGDASWDNRKLLEGSKFTDFIPSYGYPVSDFWFGLLDDDFVSDLIVGRLPVKSTEEADFYVDKLIEYDTIPSRPWMKKFLNLTGGLDSNERKYFKETIVHWANFILKTPLCADTVTIAKKSSETVGEKQSSHIREQINDGAVWVNYIGHASAGSFDMDGWEVEKLNNRSRYSLLTTFSCNTGAFGNPYIVSRNESYAVSPNRGFIASIGPSNTSHVEVGIKILYNIMRTLAEENLRGLGELLYRGKFYLALSEWWEARSLYQYTLLGDPLTRLRIDTVPDLLLVKQEIETISSSGNEIVNEDDDFVTISGILHNAGTYEYDNAQLIISAEYEEERFTDSLDYTGFCLEEAFDFVLPVKGKPGIHKITIHADPYETTRDPNRSNNIIEFEIIVYTTGMLALDPLPFWDVNADDPFFRLINPLSWEGEFSYEFIISSLQDTLAADISVSSESEIETTEAYIEWNPDINLEHGESYWLRARLYDHSKKGYSSWLWIPFIAKTDGGGTETDLKIISKDNFAQCTIDSLKIFVDNDSVKVSLEKQEISYSIISVSGIDENTPKFCEININERDYISNVHKLGFNVVAVSQYTGIGRYKNFQTFSETKDCQELVYFLRDSVRDDEYVLIGGNGKAFNWPFYLNKIDPGNVGSFDTLSKVLRDFGSQLVSSVDTNGSFSMAGWRGAALGLINEKIDNSRDTALIEGKLKIYKTHGSITTPEAGPAKEWKNININGLFPENDAKTNISVIGISRKNKEETILKSVDNFYTVDLSDISAFDYPYIKLKLDMEVSYKSVEENMSVPVEHYISMLNYGFLPAPEFAVIRSESTLKTDSLMRGEEINFEAVIQNISRRTASEDSYLRIEVTAQQGDPLDDYHFPLEVLQPDEKISIPFTLQTKEYKYNNLLFINVDDTAKANELYRFNNKAESDIQIYEDSEKPRITLKIDGIEVENYDFVAFHPEFLIEIRDNSPLAIETPSKLRVKLNSRVVNEENTLEYDLNLNPSPPDLKAVLKFKKKDSLDITLYPDSPTPRGNLIIIYAEDATGNKDTLSVYINVAISGTIIGHKNYPNPFNNGTTFEFEYKAPVNGGEAIIDIFNSIGQYYLPIIQEPLTAST